MECQSVLEKLLKIYVITNIELLSLIGLIFMFTALPVLKVRWMWIWTRLQWTLCRFHGYTTLLLVRPLFLRRLMSKFNHAGWCLTAPFVNKHNFVNLVNAVLKDIRKTNIFWSVCAVRNFLYWSLKYFVSISSFTCARVTYWASLSLPDTPV